MLEVQNIKYSYNKDYQALKGVSLKVEKGEMVALLGKNGAGKSTLFLHLNGIYEPDEGQVFIDGEELKYDKKSLTSPLIIEMSASKIRTFSFVESRRHLIWDLILPNDVSLRIKVTVGNSD